MNVAGHANIFAIGDVAATDPLEVRLALAYRVLAHNSAELLGKMPIDVQSAELSVGVIVGPQDDGLRIHSRCKYSADRAV